MRPCGWIIRRASRSTASTERGFIDSFDYGALRRELLEPLGPRGGGRFRAAVTRGKYERRYVPGQRLYLTQCRPRDRAPIVVDNSVLDRPTTRSTEMTTTAGKRNSRARGSGRARDASTRSTDVLREIALRFPDVEEATTQRGVAFKARGRLLACAAIHQSAEPSSVVIRIGVEQRARLMAAYPEALYLPAHYAKHPAVLARLARLDHDSLRDILGAAWLFVTENAVARKSSGSRRKRRPRGHS